MFERQYARRLAIAATLVIASGLSACKDDNPAAPIPGAGDPENISRVAIVLTRVGTSTTVQSVIRDPDGTQGVQAPGAPQGTLTLAKGATYNGVIQLSNDLDPNNVVDIIEEVTEEANFHRFFYSFTCGGVSVPVSSLDLDTQSPPQPLGVSFQVVVDASAASTTSCQLHVELHHFEEDKGDGLGSVFETDLSIDFPVTIS